MRITAELQIRLDRANQALGRLDGITLLLPDPDVFLYPYVRKEAVRSSQIEGTQSSLSDLLLFEHDLAPGVPRGDVEEASNYVAAMQHGTGARRLGATGLSLYLKRHRDVDYEQLQRTRTDGDWEAWLRFLLDGVIDVADSTTRTTTAIVGLVARDRQRVSSLGRASATAIRVHERLVKEIVGRPSEVAHVLGLSEPPVYQAFSRLEELGIVREITGRRRGRMYAYDRYLELLNDDA